MTLAAAPTSFFLGTTDSDRCKAFYTEVLGLSCTDDSPFAVVFALANGELRVGKVQDLTPQPWTVLDFQVPDLDATMAALGEHGVAFLRYDGMDQDDAGVWTVPGAGVRIAWFEDPDHNVLSVSQR